VTAGQAASSIFRHLELNRHIPVAEPDPACDQVFIGRTMHIVTQVAVSALGPVDMQEMHVLFPFEEVIGAVNC
jgi:hypothetical protein